MSTKKKTKKKKGGKKGGHKRAKRGLGFLGAASAKAKDILKTTWQESQSPVGVLGGLLLAKVVDEKVLSKVKFLNPDPDPTTGEVSKGKKVLKPIGITLVGLTGLVIMNKKNVNNPLLKGAAIGFTAYGAGKTVSVILNKDLFGFDGAVAGLGNSGEQMFLENKEELLKQIAANSFNPDLPALEEGAAPELGIPEKIFGSQINLDNATIY